jgi:hypothetical protein
MTLTHYLQSQIKEDLEFIESMKIYGDPDAGTLPEPFQKVVEWRRGRINGLRFIQDALQTGVIEHEPVEPK